MSNHRHVTTALVLFRKKKKFLSFSLKTFVKKYSRMDQVKVFKGRLPQILLGPFLNTLSYLKVINGTKIYSMSQSCHSGNPEYSGKVVCLKQSFGCTVVHVVVEELKSKSARLVQIFWCWIKPVFCWLFRPTSFTENWTGKLLKMSGLNLYPSKNLS